MVVVSVARAKLTPFALPLRTPLTTHHGELHERRGWLLELEAEDGERGYGEAAPLAGFGGQSHAVVGATLERATRARLAALPPDRGSVSPAAASALASALCDLEARQRGERIADALARIVGEPLRQRIPVNALLAGDDPAAIAAEAEVLAAAGFETFKLKVGAAALSEDEARVAALRKALGPVARIRLDANGAWREVQALRAAERLARHAIEWIEQPVTADEPDALARVGAQSAVPIAADESVRDERSAERLLDRGGLRVLVLKPGVLGGPRVAARIAARARSAGVDVCVTTALDSAVGAGVALQLAAALPRQGPACGLASGALLARDLAALPEIRGGQMPLPTGSGLGLEPDPEALAECAIGPALELTP